MLKYGNVYSVMQTEQMVSYSSCLQLMPTPPC